MTDLSGMKKSAIQRAMRGTGKTGNRLKVGWRQLIGNLVPGDTLPAQKWGGG